MLKFQVLDADLVEQKECSSDADCEYVNKRFYEKCAKYDACGEMNPIRPPKMFHCNKVNEFDKLYERYLFNFIFKRYSTIY